VADLTSSTVKQRVPGGFNKLVIESTDSALAHCSARFRHQD